MATEYDIIATKGASLKLTFTALDETNTPIDLTQYSVSGYVRLKYSDTGVLLDLEPQIDSSYTGGLINLELTPDKLEDLPITEAVYDIKVQHISGYVAQAVYGMFEINPAVTY